MDRERFIILAVVFASSHWAAYMSTKIIVYVQKAVKLLYASNCTGTELSVILLKKFSVFLIFLIKYVFSCINLQNIIVHQIRDSIIYYCEIMESNICLFWDGIIYLNSEIHHGSSFVFGIWLPAVLSDASTSVFDFFQNWPYSSRLGGFAIILVIFIFCLLLYFAFLITLVITRLYKLFLKPLIKMLTTLLNYRRRIVLRSRGL